MGYIFTVYLFTVKDKSQSLYSRHCKNAWTVLTQRTYMSFLDVSVTPRPFSRLHKECREWHNQISRFDSCVQPALLVKNSKRALHKQNTGAENLIPNNMRKHVPETRTTWLRGDC